jgi:hypothetical protein
MNPLFRLFSPSVWRSVIHHDPMVEGRVRIETREGGKRRQVSEGKNIWTLTGREYLAEMIALSARSPRTTFRDDRVAYIGVGTGSQAEVANIESLVDPVPFVTSEFLAPTQTPALFPASGTGTPITSVQFIREYATTEISIGGAAVVLTEAGLFTDGDPDNNWAIGAPVTFTPASTRAPVAYKTFEPITKTTSFTMRVIWEIRFV